MLPASLFHGHRASEVGPVDLEDPNVAVERHCIWVVGEVAHSSVRFRFQPESPWKIETLSS